MCARVPWPGLLAKLVESRTRRIGRRRLSISPRLCATAVRTREQRRTRHTRSGEDTDRESKGPSGVVTCAVRTRYVPGTRRADLPRGVSGKSLTNTLRFAKKSSARESLCSLVGLAEEKTFSRISLHEQTTREIHETSLNIQVVQNKMVGMVYSSRCREKRNSRMASDS